MCDDVVDIELRAVAGIIVGLLPASAGGNPIYAASPNKDLGDGVDFPQRGCRYFFPYMWSPTSGFAALHAGAPAPIKTVAVRPHDQGLVRQGLPRGHLRRGVRRARPDRPRPRRPRPHPDDEGCALAAPSVRFRPLPLLAGAAALFLAAGVARASPAPRGAGRIRRPARRSDAALRPLSRRRSRTTISRPPTRPSQAGLAASPGDYELRKFRLRLLLPHHDFEGLLREAEALKKERPDDAELDGSIGDADFDLGRYPEAFAAYATLRRAPPVHRLVQPRRARARDRGRPRGRPAVDGPRRGRRASPRIPEAFAWCRSRSARILLKLNRYEEAEGRLVEALRRVPDHAPSLAVAAEIAARKGLWEPATRLAERSLALEPEAGVARRARGLPPRDGRRRRRGAREEGDRRIRRKAARGPPPRPPPARALLLGPRRTGARPRDDRARAQGPQGRLRVRRVRLGSVSRRAAPPRPSSR